MRSVLVGVGQAGGKIVQSLVRFDQRLEFGTIRGAVAVNSAESDLRALDIDTVLVGRDRVNGQGVGGDNELGAEIMAGSITEVITDLGGRITADVDAIFVIAGLGGGTGSGGAPVLAHGLKQIYDRPVYAIGVLPGKDEGAMYQANAGRSLATLVREADSVILIDNDAWRTEDESIGSAYETINERLTQRIGLLLASGEAVDGVGESVVDASEVINTLREGEIAALGYASATASDEAGENITTVVSLARQALLADMSVPGVAEAEAALLVVAGTPSAIPRKGIERARRVVEEETGSFQVRGGDFPISDDRLAAIVLLSGIERSPRIQEIVNQATIALNARARGREDPAEGFRSDELDDLF